MRCLCCQSKTCVISTRVVGTLVRRRRKCVRCETRFTTQEKIYQRVSLSTPPQVPESSRVGASGLGATLHHARYMLGDNAVTGFAFGLFLLIVEVNHRPTTSEPINLPWSISQAFMDEFQIRPRQPKGTEVKMVKIKAKAE